MTLFALLLSLAAAPDDSIAISRAQESLLRGDTLEAIDGLQEWSASHAVGQELTSLLGRLHMPDEPADLPTDSVAVVPEQAEGRAPSARKWSIRSDELTAYTDRFAWYLGAGVATGIAKFGTPGRKGSLELGVAGCLWNGIGDTIKTGFTPMVVVSVASGSWDARLDGWAGVIGDRLEVGAMSILAHRWTDSVGGSLRVGFSARMGIASTSHVGIFCQGEKRSGDLSWSARSDLRLRGDPIDGDSTSIDSLRSVVQGDRIQSASRFQVLLVRGAWSLGPALDLDLRSSLESDEWFDGEKRRKALRQEGIASVQGVTKFVTTGGAWIQARIGGSLGFGGSEIDPRFPDRNTGLAASISVGVGI